MVRLPLIALFATALTCNSILAPAAELNLADGKPVAPDASAAWTNDQKASYLIGVQMAKRLKPFAKDIDSEKLILAIQDIFANKDQAVPAAQEQAVMTAFQAAMEKKEGDRAAQRKDSNAKWLAENGKKPGMLATKSGVQYEVMKTGAGKQAALGTSVTVHYTGTLLDGTVFDSSVQRGQPADFPLREGGLIQGWIDAIPLMKEGDKWKLYIPSDLAYGERGNQGIGPNELLIFEVELIKVAAGEPQPKP
jgi:FKBP-type peptidyl-prolyl cis-trans isomerase FklB